MKNYYQKTDAPSKAEKEVMWNAISDSVLGNSSQPVVQQSPTGTAKIIEWKSFVFGNVAAIMLIFSLYGAFSLVRDLSNKQQVSGNELATDYSSAIESLNDIPMFFTDQSSQDMQGSIDSRFEGIKEIDHIITELKKDIAVNGATESKQRQLRRMYAMKLDMLKEIMLQGDFAL